MKKTYKIDVDCANCANRDLVAERLADLRNTERKLFSRGDADQVEVHENRLACFGAEISDMFLVEDGADVKAVMEEVRKNCKKVEDDCEVFI